jgi:alpha-tubulin suppressor-like RCC1 family protein
MSAEESPMFKRHEMIRSKAWPPALAITLIGLWCCARAEPEAADSEEPGPAGHRPAAEDGSPIDPVERDGGSDSSDTSDARDASDGAPPVRMQLAVGAGHTCVLRPTGKIACWGLNYNGQLGDGTNVGHPSPVDVAGISSAIAIAAGTFHTCAILRGGAVECWGDNYYQQLGRPASPATTSNVPVAVTGLSGPAVSIGADGLATCAVLGSGAVQCWGYNEGGQLGDATMTKRTSAVSVNGIAAGATSVRPGSYHACSVVGGGIRCWGYNGFGALGDGTHNASSTPVSVVGLGAFPDTSELALAGGDLHTCVIVSGGQVRCWGSGTGGQLGNGSHTSSDAPVTVSGLANVGAIASAYAHTCALLKTGTLSCWGDNTYGQLATDAGVDRPTPVTIAGLGSPITDVACGGGNFAIGSTGYATGQSCAIVNGAVWCWGDNKFGQLGNGAYVASLTPVMVKGL